MFEDFWFELLGLVDKIRRVGKWWENLWPYIASLIRILAATRSRHFFAVQRPPKRVQNIQWDRYQ